MPPKASKAPEAPKAPKPAPLIFTKDQIIVVGEGP